MTNPDIQKDRWHVNREVPLALIFLVIAQFVGVVVYVNDLKNDVSHNSEILQDMKGNGTHSRLVRVEEQTRAIQETLRRVEQKLDRRASLSHRPKSTEDLK